MSADLREDALRASLTGVFGTPLKVLDSVGSTNDEAATWADAGAPEGAIVIADHQRSGRGRWGRSWFDRPGQALMFSIVLRPRVPAARAGLLATALGLACAEAIEDECGLATRVKWPNDVTVNGRKLAGILVETRAATSTIERAIAGIGINVTVDPAELPEAVAERATSIAAELKRTDTRRVPSRPELFGAILRSLESIYPLVKHPAGAAELIARASDRSEVVGNAVDVTFPDGRAARGIATALTPSGGLEVSFPDGPRTIQAAEIQSVRPLGRG